LEELKEVLGVGMEECDEIMKIISDVDANGDNQISFSEFKAMMLKLYKG
jgi:Ca2+-binding EF-hand superfamily protein